MKFDDGSLEGGGSIDLAGIGIDKETRDNLGLGEFFDDGTKSLNLICGVEPALGCDFGSIFGDEAYFGGLEAESELQHRRGSSHFEVELFAAFAAESENVVVLDVAAVLAEVDSDGVSSCGQAGTRERDGIGLWDYTWNRNAVPRLTKGGEVINVYAKSDHSYILS
jgi:hypothetical protein